MKNTVKVERAKLNITQEELAKGVNVSRQTINSIESGRYDPSVILALKIARFFKTTVDQIFTLEPDDK
jgi:putative transcriptional regulator